MGKFANPAAKLSFEHEFVQIIDGKPSATERTRHGVNPANLEQKPEVPVASSNDVDRAVAAAQVAFKSWSKIPQADVETDCAISWIRGMADIQLPE
ncbi:hypothetical protein CH063_04418, partial [Colletotrichum higginsianum]